MEKFAKPNRISQRNPSVIWGVIGSVWQVLGLFRLADKSVAGNVGASRRTIAAVMTVLTQGSAVDASEFEASGVIRHENLQAREWALQNRAAKSSIPLLTNSSFTFRVFVRDCKWRIQLSPEEDAGGDFPFVIDAGSDGVDTYVVLAPRAQSSGSGAQGGSVINLVAQVSKGPVLLDIPTAPIVWLALCSGCYMDSATTNRLVPVDIVMPRGIGSLQDIAVRAAWEKLGGNSKLPGSLKYFQDGIDPPFDKGFVMGQYRALRTTNIQDQILPVEFQFQSLAPRYPNPTNGEDAKLLQQWHGQVLSVSGASQLFDEEFVPRLTNRAAIADRRFAGEGVPLVGHLTNSWPGEKAVHNSSGFGIWKKAGQNAASLDAQESRGQGARRVLIVLFLITSAGAPVFLWWRRYRSASDTLTDDKSQTH